MKCTRIFLFLFCLSLVLSLSVGLNVANAGEWKIEAGALQAIDDEGDQYLKTDIVLSELNDIPLFFGIKADSFLHQYISTPYGDLNIFQGNVTIGESDTWFGSIYQDDVGHDGFGFRYIPNHWKNEYLSLVDLSVYIESGGEWIFGSTGNYEFEFAPGYGIEYEVLYYTDDDEMIGYGCGWHTFADGIRGELGYYDWFGIDAVYGGIKFLY